MIDLNTDPAVMELDALITRAEANAETDWEISFVEEMRAKLKRFGERATFSEAQIAKLENIAVAGGFWEQNR